MESSGVGWWKDGFGCMIELGDEMDALMKFTEHTGVERYGYYIIVCACRVLFKNTFFIKRGSGSSGLHGYSYQELYCRVVSRGKLASACIFARLIS